ncbi:hypothetical protein PHMEG_00034313 [Phytophthora megakarya]|uniref:Uncharacterized protein n=1 Tax=Phytophthora megakarya TaxID=4795 RepID=A0A225URB0_9STRA|nr:hypothetical protein PHMEG_00034313 [Phytophthora megakarya]
MRVPKRTTPHATLRIRWMNSESPGVPTPMDRLVSWLERIGEEFRTSKRKLDLLEQLGDKNGDEWHLRIDTEKGCKRKLKGGKCASNEVNQYYDRLLELLFSEEERVEMRERAVRRTADQQQERTDRQENHKKRRTRATSRVPRDIVIKEELDTSDEDRRTEVRGANSIIDPILNSGHNGDTTSF